MKNTKHFISLLAIFIGSTYPIIGYSDETEPSTPGSYITGKDLKSIFENTTMSGEYRVFRGDTKTYHYTEHHNADGTSEYIEGKRHEQGLWYILGGNKICYRYPHSKQHTDTYCFVVYNVDGCYYKFSQYDMTLKGPRHWDLWTSRAARKGHGGSCDAPIG